MASKGKTETKGFKWLGNQFQLDMMKCFLTVELGIVAVPQLASPSLEVCKQGLDSPVKDARPH